MVTGIPSVNGPAFQSQVAGASVPQSRPGTANVGGVRAEQVNISSAASIQLGQDQSITAGKLINLMDQTLAKQQETLGRMNDKLQMIVKQIPPLGVHDPERIAYLKEFYSLRAQMESLKVPPDLQVESGITGTINLPGPSQGLNLPNLTSGASDKQVAEAAQSTQTAIMQVAGQRADLAQNVRSALGDSYTSLARRLA